MLTRIGEAGTFFLLLSVVATGCASRGQVRHEVDRLAAKAETLDRLGERVAELDAAIEHEQSALDAQASNLVEAQKKASLAAEQAERAETSAAGNLLGQKMFRVEGVGFEPGTARLTEGSRAMLDQLADRLRAENAAYFIEVRSAGVPGSDRGLEGARAEEVRHYLHAERGLPLHAISTLSGGDEPPEPETGLARTLEVAPDPDAPFDIVVVRDQPKP